MFKSEHIDRIGIIASTVCFIHCIFTPIILSISIAASSFLPSEAHFHKPMAVLVSLLGVLTLIRGYGRHKKGIILALMLSGLALIFGGAFLPISEVSGTIITISGSICLVLAHHKNHSFCNKQCKCSHEV
jgi:membrane-bound ClpP family serine protease